MGTREKRLAKLRARPPRMRFDELATILTEDFDFVERKSSGGSHVIFKSPTYGTIPIPKDRGRWVKGVYLDQVCLMLGLDDISDLD